MTPPYLLPRLLAALLAAASASAHHVHILDAPGPAPPLSSTPSSISPTTARLVFAQRLGLAEHFAVGDGLDDAGIAAINALGGFSARQPLFAPATAAAERHRQRGLVVVQGVEHAEDVLPKDRSGWRALDIDRVPGSARTEELLAELDAAMGEGAGRIELHGPNENWVRRVDGRSISYSMSLERVGREHGLGSPEYRQEAAVVRHAIEEAARHSDLASLTVVVLPPEQHCDGSATWGVSPRQQAKRREKRQAALSAGGNLAHVAASLPSRYTSLPDCQRTTKNCTGHGHCKVVYSEAGSGSQRNEYFGCVCDIPQVERSKDGSVRKTTRFGGAACQKVDVSAPFWILFSTSVFLILVVAMGVRMLYSMGGEELPSVIGAGVTGPAPRK